ncbi:adenylate/guanylate cyclase domain-containing protein [Sphingomonas crocodyli]|uniref:Adenylate/guanylate cyclase domain-containing protein n=1 Tax=Sphingomonas crocodyli TaxID=1979270 RepID=A0A437LUX4_9SPHN|nr:adenylate/guanylate cyclase domain-containing protein [Sphingomonas crocodyli]RVT89231.1 adenylate/guanylate cyclase domain-containing protein [Sphingomonas crocodyli]
MAVLLRSISVKIFGVAVVLLIVMAMAAVWSGRLTEQVHLQLRTFNHALFPMAITIAEVESAMTAELGAPYPAGPGCAKVVRRRLATSDELIAQARTYRSKAARMAVLERNKLELARLEPMLDELAASHKLLGDLTERVCRGEETARAEARLRIADIQRVTGAVSHEIEGFVAAGALIVGDNQKRAMQANFLLIGAAGLVGLMLAWAVARGLTRPISRLHAGAHAVRQGQLDAEIPVTTADEIGDVTRAFNEMIVGLREKERITATFGQYVDPRVVAGLVGAEADRSTIGEKQVATVFFSDIAGFTPLSERLAPATLVRLINAYFSAMSACIRDRQGIIDKYIGDAIMAFWVPPFVEADAQAELACRAALDQLAALDRFRADIPDLVGMRRDLPAIDIRIGIATGEVVVGSVGSDHARSFTTMGDTVNFGSRLEGVNKVYGTRILIDAATRDLAGDAIVTREIDVVRVVGREQPVAIYELAAMAGDLPADRLALHTAYAEAIRLYRAGDWAGARVAFAACVDDAPALKMLARLDRIEAAPPASWDGVWRLDSK